MTPRLSEPFPCATPVSCVREVMAGACYPAAVDLEDGALAGGPVVRRGG